MVESKAGASAENKGPTPTTTPQGGGKRSAARTELTLALETRIRRGEYAPGTWLPTERAIAGEFSVDRSTVRASLVDLADRGIVVRVPGRRPWVSEGFHPDLLAADRNGAEPAPALPAAHLAIAAILPHHPFYPAAQSILRGVARALRHHELPHRIVVFDTQDDGGAEAAVERERHALEAVATDGIGAVILWHLDDEGTLALALRLQAEGKAAVIFVDRCPEGAACDFVGVDNRAASREAVEHLLDLGHHRIACLSDGHSVSTVQDRVLGYREALLGRGILPDPDLFQIVPPEEGPVDAGVTALCSLADPPTAIFAINDVLAHGAITCLEKIGRRVPGDVSVIGFDDLEQYSPRPALLTTVHQPFERIGERAAELALRRHRAAGASTTVAFQHILLPAPLVKRATDSPPGTSAP